MPKVDTTVGSLVDMISRGDLKLPELQRRYVWPATRVRDLLDSLYRGYPSGTILVWDTDQDVPSRDFAVKQESGGFRPKLLLDGQQRLTSLSASIRGEPIHVKNRANPIEIAFNLNHPETPFDVIEVEGDDSEVDDSQDDEDEADGGDLSIREQISRSTFIVGWKALFSDPHWVKVSDIFATKNDWQLLKPLGITPDDPKYEVYSERLQKVRAIREYPYVMHVLERSLPYEEVAEIFVRVNSLGMKLRGSDLALAQITARWRNSLALFEGFAEECERTWFTFDIGLLVRAMVVFATRQSRFRTVASIPVEELQAAWEHAKAGLRFAVSFLRSNAAIEDESLLSSPFLVIPVAVLSVLRENEFSNDEGRALLEWLFVANAKGHYSGSSETVLDNDLSTLFKGGTAADLLAILKQKFGRVRFDAGDFARRTKRNPIFPVTYLALKHAGAKDWWSGLKISLSHQGSTHSIQFHHIFPKSVLSTEGYEGNEVNEIANLAFISGKKNRTLGNKTPDKYFPDVVEGRGLEALKSQAIPTDQELWLLENYSLFIEWRRAELARVVNDFLDEVSSEGGTGTDVEQLMSEGEGQKIEFKSTARFNQLKGGVDRDLELAIAKTVAGFMNSKGGTLLIGVNDSGIAVGLSNDIGSLKKRNNDGFGLFLTELIGSTIGKERLTDVSISFAVVDGLEICAVGVVPSPNPAYLTEGSDQRFYVRTNNATNPLTTQEAVSYISEHWP